MQYLRNGLLVAAAGLMMFSCNEDNPWSGPHDEGGIRLRLSTDASVFTGGESTRADDGVVVPDGSDFKIRLSKTDGSLRKDFSSLSEFEKEAGFAIGEYKIEAYYGDLAEEGFEKPYFHAEENVSVRAGASTQVSMTASLCNSIVSVDFTDDFKNEYPSYSASAWTRSANKIKFVQDEKRGAYLAPGTIELELTLTNKAGKSVTFNPASFVAEAQHKYNVRFGVESNGADNSLRLTVEFDDQVENEVVEIDLSDVVFNTPVPEVRPIGFSSGDMISMMRGDRLDSDSKFHVFAYAGLKEANFEVVASGNDYTPSFGEKINLMAADALQQSKLEEEGIEAAGFFRNPDKMAVLNLSRYLSRLPKGSYKISLGVVDNFSRVGDAVTLAVDVTELEMNVEVLESDLPLFGGDEINVYVSSNSSRVKDKMSFETSDSQGVLKAAQIKKIEDISTKSDDNVRFKYVVSMESNSASKVGVKVFYNSEVVKSYTVSKNVPDFSIATDAFSDYVRMKVEGVDAKVARAIVNGMTLLQSGSAVNPSNISRDSENMIVTAYGLTPATSYSSMSVELQGAVGVNSKNLPAFVTETQLALPNGDFSEAVQTININPINAGGKYKYGATTMQNKSSILVSEPKGWASVNDKTCYSGSANKNTWFMVPSTLMKDGKVVVRSVAYDHNGTDPALDNHGLSVRAKYSRNAPASFASVASGELFLGSYSFDGSESRNEGTAFASRPSSLEFDYSYAPVGSEQGEVVVGVYDASGNLISSGESVINAGNGTLSVNLSGYPFGAKAASIRVKFLSTKGTSISAPVPSDIADVTNKTSLSGQTIATNAYKSLCVGSVLTVENVKVGYGVPTTRSSSKTLKARKK